MKKYFTTSLYIAQHNKPYTDFPSLMDLQLHNFADPSLADKYKSYKSDKQCKQFIDCIPIDLKETNASDLDDECFIAILADDSTDKLNTEEKMFMWRC